VLVDVTNKTAVATNNAAVVSTLLDGAVGASCSSGDGLPDDLALVAETELGGAVADDGAVSGASTFATSSGSSCGCSA
jgi:hypothetical protein